MVIRLPFSAPAAPAALAAMLEHIEQPALLVAERGLRIVAANLDAGRQSGYSREALRRQVWEQLFPELSWQMLTALEGQEVVSFLQHREGRSRKVVCRAHALEKERKLWLVVFAPPVLREEPTRPRETALERIIRHVVEGVESADPDTMLERLLKEMTRALGATWGAVYLLASPAYRLRSKTGAAPDLPLALPLQHGALLRQPHAFGPEAVAETALHAVVRTAEAPYMVAAPLGEGPAVEGFVAFGYSQPPPTGAVQRAASLARGLRQVVLCRLQIGHEREEEKRIHQAVGVLHLLLEHAYEGVLVFDAALHLRGMSRSAEEMLGYARDEAAGAAFSDLIVGEAALETAARQALTLNQLQALEAHLLRRDGTEFPVEVRLLPCRPHGEKQPQGVLALLHDLSAEERYRLQSQRLMWRAMLGDVLASFAHEVRDPLNSISTGLEWLELSLPEHAPARETVSALQQDVERMTELVKHLLDYSRTRTLQLKPMDVGTLLEGILRRWERRFRRYRIEPVFHVADDIPQVLGDRLSLEQVFVNLIDNAIHAVKEQPGERFVGVKVSASVSDNGTRWVEVAVTDNGPGFTEEVGRHIFEPFYTTRKDGYGLGLSITRQLVTAHRGSIDAASYVGGGTVFRVRLRAVEEE